MHAGRHGVELVECRFDGMLNDRIARISKAGEHGDAIAVEFPIEQRMDATLTVNAELEVLFSEDPLNKTALFVGVFRMGAVYSGRTPD